MHILMKTDWLAFFAKQFRLRWSATEIQASIFLGTALKFNTMLMRYMYIVWVLSHSLSVCVSDWDTALFGLWVNPNEDSFIFAWAWPSLGLSSDVLFLFLFQRHRCLNELASTGSRTRCRTLGFPRRRSATLFLPSALFLEAAIPVGNRSASRCAWRSGYGICSNGLQLA